MKTWSYEAILTDLKLKILRYEHVKQFSHIAMNYDGKGMKIWSNSHRAEDMKIKDVKIGKSIAHQLQDR